MVRLPPPIRLFLFIVVISQSANAGIDWQSFSVSYLRGSDYRVGDAGRDVFTFEHAAGTTWGDSFMFWDHMQYDDGTTTNYGEWAPRLSLCKTGWYCVAPDPSAGGLLKDVLIATTLEMGDGFTNYLYGVGFSFNLPAFKYANINLYRRDHDFKQDNWQTTITWGLPFTVAGEAFLYDGFIDWYTSTDDERSSLNWTSQLKWNLASHFDLSAPLYIGFEYVHWHNKYGIEDRADFHTYEKNLNLLLKWHW